MRVDCGLRWMASKPWHATAADAAAARAKRPLRIGTAFEGGTPLGANPMARVHRGPGKVPFREHASKIRDKTTGLLVEPPRSARGDGIRPEVSGERMRSTRYFRAEAERYCAAAMAGDRHAKRMLDAVRLECSLFMQGQRDGALGPEPVEPRVAKVKLKPPSQRYLERRARWDGRSSPKRRRASRKAMKLRNLHRRLDLEIASLM